MRNPASPEAHARCFRRTGALLCWDLNPPRRGLDQREVRPAAHGVGAPAGVGGRHEGGHEGARAGVRRLGPLGAGLEPACGRRAVGMRNATVAGSGSTSHTFERGGPEGPLAPLKELWEPRGALCRAR